VGYPTATLTRRRWRRDTKLANAFQESLKTEIGRVARQQLKDELESLRQSSKKQRSDIAALRRDVAALTSELKKLKKSSEAGKKNDHPEAAPASVLRPVSAEELVRHREALQLTQLEVSLLIGVSSQTIYKWEGGNVAPRARHLPLIHQFLKLGKRAAKHRLEEMASAGG
jgi:DNA-binding transcriptional regulator YiaG